jgi:hypothetical protein
MHCRLCRHSGAIDPKHRQVVPVDSRQSCRGPCRQSRCPASTEVPSLLSLATKSDPARPGNRPAKADFAKWYFPRITGSPPGVMASERMRSAPSPAKYVDQSRRSPDGSTLTIKPCTQETGGGGCERALTRRRRNTGCSWQREAGGLTGKIHGTGESTAVATTRKSPGSTSASRLMEERRRRKATWGTS